MNNIYSMAVPMKQRGEAYNIVEITKFIYSLFTASKPPGKMNKYE